MYIPGAEESDAAGNINFSMFLAAVEHTQALSLGKVLRRLRLEVASGRQADVARCRNSRTVGC